MFWLYLPREKPTECMNQIMGQEQRIVYRVFVNSFAFKITFQITKYRGFFVCFDHFILTNIHSHSFQIHVFITLL